jgi:microcystin-dependent protein/energy-coupling factor transporter ATP-binding protein EcfA2
MNLRKLIASTIMFACLITSSSMGMDERKDEFADEARPEAHICPITLAVMRNPVVAGDGQTYERQAIEAHFERRARAADFERNGFTSPITGQPLRSRDLFDNHALRAMITDWRPGRENRPSELDGKPAEAIAQAIQRAFDEQSSILTPEKRARGRDIVAFLGVTGSGKSTLINFLSGKRLVVENGNYVLANPDEEGSMRIGVRGGSETFHANSVDIGGTLFFDLPGFADTNGTERNLVISAFIRQILLEANSVKLVFVADQNEIPVGRGIVIKQLFNSITQLLVSDQDVNLVDGGMFIATKVRKQKRDILGFLLEKTDSRDKADLHQQFRSWGDKRSLCCMFDASDDEAELKEKREHLNNDSLRTGILSLIGDMRPVKIRSINVSALYPPDTQRDLRRLFHHKMVEFLGRGFETSLRETELAAYDRDMAFYAAEGFWQTFDANLCREEAAIGLIKDFATNPYRQAFMAFEGQNEDRRRAHVQTLTAQRQARVTDIERRTGERAEAVIRAVAAPFLAPGQNVDDWSPLNFASYQKDYYDQVCGDASIVQLATDPEEQRVVRQEYAAFIARRSRAQLIGSDVMQEQARRVAQLLERLETSETAHTQELERLRAAAQEREERLIARLEASERVQAEAQAREDRLIERFEASEATRIQALQGLRAEVLAPAQSARIADGAITTAHLGAGSVQTVSIADRAVTSNQLGLQAVISDRIADGAVRSAHLGPQAVTIENIHGAALSFLCPPGVLMEWTTQNAPRGWLLANGQAVSRATYNVLFQTIGVTFGTGNGATTFNVPDRRGRVSVGCFGADTGGLVTRANRIAIGGIGGEEDHQLSVDEMPSHTHGNKGFNGGEHREFSSVSPESQSHAHQWSYSGTNTVSPTGGDQPHNNMPPFILMPYIISTGAY